MRYGLREIVVAMSLAVTAACCPPIFEARAAETKILQIAQNSDVTPLPTMPRRPVLLPDQSGAAAPAASLQGLVPSTGSMSRPGSVPMPMQSSTQAPMAQPIAGAAAPASTR